MLQESHKKEMLKNRLEVLNTRRIGGSLAIGSFGQLKIKACIPESKVWVGKGGTL